MNIHDELLESCAIIVAIAVVILGFTGCHILDNHNNHEYRMEKLHVGDIEEVPSE